VPLLGKPDLWFETKEGFPIILDWKVSGYCSKWHTSPKKGYTLLRPGGASHRDALLLQQHGILINAAHPLEVIDEDWARQLTIYSWIMQNEAKPHFVVALDQIVCNNVLGKGFKVAEFRSLVGDEFQSRLLDQIKLLWSSLEADHFYPELSLLDSRGRCKLLRSRNPSKWRAELEGNSS
jgi:hypothetical protein